MIAFLLSACLLGADDFPLVEQHVEAISASWLPDGSRAFYFWDLVQGEWAFIDKRYERADMAVSYCDGRWRLEWQEEEEACFRVVTCDCWIETVEIEDPRTDETNRPWFRQLCQIGLRPVPVAREKPN